MSSHHTSQISLSDGREAFLSYGVIVAGFIPGRGYVRTDRYFSVTTSKHANQYAGKDAPKVPHVELVALLAPIVSRL